MKRILLSISFLVLLISACQPIFENHKSEATVDPVSARRALLRYFEILNQKNYDQVETIFGGDLQVLLEYNPDVRLDQVGKLFESACTINGFQCLAIKNILDEKKIDDFNFVFMVEFQTNEGDLFVLGPCCGATAQEMPPVSQFPIRVSWKNGEYRVMDLPPYVP